MPNDGLTYAFQDTTAPTQHRKHRRGGRKDSSGNQQPTGDSESVTGSLTYSASSSINSGSSAAGESTDSSFADIMKVLDLDDSSELAALMAREGMNQDLLRRGAGRVRAAGGGGGAGSVSDSLNYSEDGESTMAGEHIAQSVTGQPSDSYGPDGGGLGTGNDSIFFAPAMPEDNDPRKRKSSKTKGPRRTSSNRTSSSDKRKSSKSIASDERSSSGSAATPTSPPPRSAPPKKRSDSADKVWYAQWWMCGFTDALSELGPISKK